jgi:hypothetical protein
VRETRGKIFFCTLEDFYIEAYVFTDTQTVAKYKGIMDAGVYFRSINISGVK